ncbi:MAG: protein translocase subunit SecF [Actinomycetes bacterium]
MSRLGRLGHNLYVGQVSYDFVGRRRIWYSISGVIVAVAVLGLSVFGLNLGIEFKGGAAFVVPVSNCSVPTARAAVASAGVNGAQVQSLSGGRIRIQTPTLTTDQSQTVANSVASACHVVAGDIQIQIVGPTWGSQITKKALTGLLVFIAFTIIFLTLYFEWRMAAGAIVALIHDVLITIGIYAISRFEVTPATVIGVLTILGYSLYDTVVVFDKVKENTKTVAGQNRYTYSGAANLAVNQTLVRSINTSVVALLPVAAILFVGAGLLGAGTLKDLALALFVGIAAGTYSSIFVATPVLCQLKERDPAMQALARRVSARNSAVAKSTGQPADPDGANEVDDADQPVASSGSSAGRPTGPRNQPRRAKPRRTR